MARSNIPVVDIHAGNVTEYWPALTLAIKSATFIALDLVRLYPVGSTLIIAPIFM